MNRTILIAAGGSGGHLLPAQQLAAMLGDARVVFAGGLLSKSPFFERTRFVFEDISSAPFLPFHKFVSSGSLGIIQSIRLLKRLRPDVVVGFGSYHAFPVLAAAAIMRMKIVLYEANCVLGKVNRLFLPFSKVLALQFPLESSLRRSHEYVSYFPWVSDGKKYTKQEARSFYGFDDSLPVCLVFGGSQGAAFFNEEAPKVLSGCQVIHCTGKEEVVPKVRLAYEAQQIRAFVQSFECDMGRAYAAADIALCRGGASTIAELIHYHVPAVVVPFPWASNDHQRVNAEFFCKKAKGGIWLAQKEFCGLRSAIQRCLLQRRELLESLELFYQKTAKKVELSDLVRSI